MPQAPAPSLAGTWAWPGLAGFSLGLRPLAVIPEALGWRLVTGPDAAAQASPTAPTTGGPGSPRSPAPGSWGNSRGRDGRAWDGSQKAQPPPPWAGTHGHRRAGGTALPQPHGLGREARVWLVGTAEPGWAVPRWGARHRSGADGGGQGHRWQSTYSMESRLTSWADLEGVQEGEAGLAWAGRSHPCLL